MHPRTEEDLISRWLDLAGEEFGEYGWAGPGTWAVLARPIYPDFDDNEHVGALGEYNWIKPEPFEIKILMSPFADEGRIYLAHAGTKYLKFVSI